MIDSKIKIKNSNFKNILKFRDQLIYNSNNLKVYNDSKCTNLNNAIYKNNLINSSQKILILGGKLKKQHKTNKFKVKNTLVLIFGYHHNLFIDNLNFVNSNYFKFNNLILLINFLKLILKLQKYDHILFSYHGVPERHVNKVYLDGTPCKDHHCDQEINNENKLCYLH